MTDTTETDSALATSPEADALVKEFLDTPVTRCDACGYDVDAEDGHICDRTGGRLVQCHPRGCAVKGCAVMRRGTVLPSLSHHAGHMQWHLDQWAKEKAAGPVVAAPARTVDRWVAGSLPVPAGGGALAVLQAPAPGAVCVALLFSSEHLTHLAAECWNVGQAPLSAYLTYAAPLFALVPVDGAKPGEGGDVSVLNPGGFDVFARVGGRWEMPKND